MTSLSLWVLHLQPTQHGVIAGLADGLVVSIDPTTLAHSAVGTYGLAVVGVRAVDEHVVVTGANEGVRVYDLRTASPVATFGHRSPITTVGASAFGTIGAGTELVGVDAEVLVWDLRLASLLHTFDSHHDDLTDIKFHPTDRTCLATGSTDGYVNVHDLAATDPDEFLVQTINYALVHSVRWCSERRLGVLSHMETFSVFERSNVDDETPDPAPKDFGNVRERWNCDYVVDVYDGYVAVGGKGTMTLFPWNDAKEKASVKRAWELGPVHGGEVVRAAVVVGGRLFTGGEDNRVETWKLGLGDKPKDKSKKRFKPY